MEALILSCGTGGGHNAAGKAVMEELERRGHNVVMLDPFSLGSGMVKRCVDGVYIGMVQKMPLVFGVVYTLGSLVRRLPGKSPVYYANRKWMTKMNHYLKTNHADVVIMPHLFPAEIFTGLKNAGETVPPSVFIATDYTCIPFTEETDCNAYVIPSKELEKEFIDRGIAEDRLYACGIPVSQGFEKKSSKKEARAALGLNQARRYVLISGGSVGAGSIETSLDVLYRYFAGDASVELIIVCGGNDKLYTKLRRKYKGKTATGLRIIRRTERMAEYLSACDLYISKPGGLSSTEAAVSMIPLIHISPIPGCETRNMNYFSKHGMSVAIEGNEIELKLPEAAERLLFGPERERMMQRQKRFCSRNAAGRICDLAEQVAKEGKEDV